MRNRFFFCSILQGWFPRLCVKDWVLAVYCGWARLCTRTVKQNAMSSTSDSSQGLNSLYQAIHPAAQGTRFFLCEKKISHTVLLQCFQILPPKPKPITLVISEKEATHYFLSSWCNIQGQVISHFSCLATDIMFKTGLNCYMEW